MNAKKCDRCGKFYDIPSVAPNIEVKEYVNLYGVKTWDLCSGCIKKLEEFLEGEDKND